MRSTGGIFWGLSAGVSSVSALPAFLPAFLPASPGASSPGKSARARSVSPRPPARQPPNCACAGTHTRASGPHCTALTEHERGRAWRPVRPRQGAHAAGHAPRPALLTQQIQQPVVVVFDGAIGGPCLQLGESRLVADVVAELGVVELVRQLPGLLAGGIFGVVVAVAPQQLQSAACACIAAVSVIMHMLSICFCCCLPARPPAQPPHLFDDGLVAVAGSQMQQRVAFGVFLVHIQRARC